MGDTVMAGSAKILFSNDFEDLHDDGFVGSADEYRIFAKVFYGNDSASGNRCVVNSGEGCVVTGCDYNKQTDISLCSNSGNSSLTSQDDCFDAKEDLRGKTPLECLSEDLTSSNKNNHEAKLAVENHPNGRPDLGDILNISVCEGVVMGMSQQDSYTACHTITHCLLESSGEGVIFRHYQPKGHVHLGQGYEISGTGGFKSRLSSDGHDQKDVVSIAITSPASQESYASKLLVMDPAISVKNKLGSHRPAKPRWKDSCFLKLDDDELSMPRDIKNDPRPLLRYHINRLLRAAGWVIGRRKRKSKYNGIGEYVYKSPGGRPFREFHRAWSMCGESLLTDAIDFVQRNDSNQWNDMTELWTDLSTTFKEIEEKHNSLETTSALAHLWCLLDPFAKVVFIDKTIRSLKKGIAVEAKRSFPCARDGRPAAKYRKILRNDQSEILFEVPIISENTRALVGGRDTHQDSNTGSQSISKDRPEEEGCSGYDRRVHKKSRKISEMKVTSLYQRHLNAQEYSVEETTSCRIGSKKSKTSHLNDDDLLISAIKKNKTIRSSKKLATYKSKPLRRPKRRKGSCRLLIRSLNKGSKHLMEGKWSASELRTVLSWLVQSGVVSLNEVIQLQNLKTDVVLKDGLITRGGVLCKCCNKVLSISAFKTHADLGLKHHCINLFMESGKPLTSCQLEAWSAEYKARKVAPQSGQGDETDQNDDSCGRCGDVGELICCDNCPSAFHQSCLFEQELPEGSWYCPQCRCLICGAVVHDKDASQSHSSFKCSQCEFKYHETCMQGKGMKIEMASDNWFCGEYCQEVYSGLRSRIGLINHLSDDYSWTLLQCINGEQKVHSDECFVALKAECNSKLAVAITILEDCFLPMVDPKTGINMIPQVMYNWGSELARLNYSGFYTVVLEKDDIMLSVASIRIHGVTVAELPLVATCNNYRRRGLCRLLINSIEEMLKSLRVEKLVVSAIPSVVETWTKGFGFKPLEDDERQSLSKINLMVFPGSVWLQKPLHQSTMNQENGPIDASTSGANDPGEMGTLEEGFSTTQSVREANTETGTILHDLENSQSHEKQEPDISSDEQEHGRFSNHDLSVQEARIETGSGHAHSENTQSHEKQDPDISSDEQELRRLFNHEFSVQEAHTETGSGFALSENMQSHEKQDPDISFDEHVLRRLSNHEFSVQEAHTETGSGRALSGNRQSYEKQDPVISFHEKELRQLSNHNLSVQEAHTETGSGHARSENLQSDVKHDPSVFFDEQEERKLWNHSPFIQEAKSETENRNGGSQVEVVACTEANEMYAETVFGHAHFENMRSHENRDSEISSNEQEGRRLCDHDLPVQETRTETETRNGDYFNQVNNKNHPTFSTNEVPT
ncbi:increased DNA methylation 1-like [Olea europaea var. sylvestris]|uniref:increased DNA methylation 1-like n=1 Tax=Olea europaea var. sylvestris TaxID=158386 RepID=UPI000C1CE3F3|nr:increased DNA methylation 1-like [Olea europaea var. sylvestris]